MGIERVFEITIRRGSFSREYQTLYYPPNRIFDQEAKAWKFIHQVQRSFESQLVISLFEFVS